MKRNYNCDIALFYNIICSFIISVIPANAGIQDGLSTTRELQPFQL